jgi:phosphoenolpyruvate synthase/pyruvate phosphate dikinase
MKGESMDPEELEKRVRALEDLEEIKKLHQKYINLMDNLRYKEVLDLFTEDASVEVRNSGVLRGKEGLTDIYINKLGRRTARSEGHFVIEPDITIKGDTASGTWLVYMLFSKPAVEWVQGRNDAEYVKIDGTWKIKSMKFTRTNASKPDMFP